MISAAMAAPPASTRSQSRQARPRKADSRMAVKVPQVARNAESRPAALRAGERGRSALRRIDLEHEAPLSEGLLQFAERELPQTESLAHQHQDVAACLVIGEGRSFVEEAAAKP